MKNTLLLPALLLALCGAGATETTNAPVRPIPSPSARLDAPSVSQMPGATNGPQKLQSSPTTIYADTNAVLALPYVQQALQQVFAQGVQFGVAAGLQNKTLVQMDDAQGLQKAAMFLRFGNQTQGKR